MENNTTMTNNNEKNHQNAAPKATQQTDTAMILAAGFGTRMRPLTLETPKPLLAVADVPLIEWHIHAIKAAGITNIVINTAWLADKLMAALGDGSQYGVKILWSQEDDALETAGGIRKALHLLGEKPFLLVNGDVWTTTDYAAVIANAEKAASSPQGCDAYLCLVDNPAHNPTGDFLLTNSQVQVKANQAAQGFTFAGVSVLNPSLFAALEVGKKAPLAPLLVNAMNAGTAFGEKLACEWVDVGTPERLQALDTSIRKHGAKTHPAWAAVG